MRPLIPVGAFAFALVWTCAPLRAQPPGGGPAPVRYAEARTHAVGISLRLPGTVESPRKAEVAASVAGLVTRIDMREGQAVERDEVLVELDRRALEIRKRTLEARLQEAEVRGQAAALRLHRTRELHGAGIASKEQLDETQFDHDAQLALQRSLTSDIAEVSLSLELITIRAPFSGVVTRKQTELGQWLRVGDPVVTLMAMGELEVVVQVPELHIAGIQTGQTARVSFDALGGAAVAGRVSVVVPQASPDARAFPVKVAVENRRGRIKEGMLGQVQFQAVRPRQATIVPKDALVTRADGHVVFVMAGDGKVAPRVVKPGEGIGDWIEVGGGLKPGDRVVTRGNERLVAGQMVQGERQEYRLP